MKRIVLNLSGMILSGIVVFILSVNIAYSEQYVLTSIHPNGWSMSRAFGINEKGQVAGYGQINGQSQLHGFIWSNYETADINPVGWKETWAYDINEAGQVAAIGTKTVAESVALFEDYSVSVFPIRGYMWTRSRGMNDIGQIVGFGKTTSSVQKALLFEGDTVTDIGPSGWTNVCAYDINNDGIAVGFGTEPSTKDTHAFKWVNGMASDIHNPSWLKSFARSINENGQIVGEVMEKRDGVFWAVVWDSNNNPTIIHQAQWKQTRARGINNTGLIVGEAESLTDGKLHAVLWENGTIIDLHPAGWIDSQFYGINDAGTIVGWGTYQSGEIRSFIIKIVP